MVLHLTPQNPGRLCAYVCTCAGRPDSRRRGARLLIQTFWGSRASDLFEAVILPILLRNAKSIHLLALHTPSPPQSHHREGGNCNKLRGFISCSALLLPLSPTPAPCRPVSGYHTPVLVLTLSLLSVFAGIIPFWDAPYLFLSTSVTRIELFSSSSKEVPDTLD